VESLYIEPGETLLSRNHLGAFIDPPSAAAKAAFFLGTGDASDLPALIRGFIVTNGGEFGPPPVWSENPNAVVEDCWIAAGGPGGWLNPVVYMKSGGTVRNCRVSSIRWTNFFVSTEPGAYMLVENCLIERPFAPNSLNAFGAGSVTVFRNNTFIAPEAPLGRDGPDITMLFENNIFWQHDLCFGGSYPVPEGLEFRYNCMDWFDSTEFPPCASAAGPGNFAEDPLFCEDPDMEWWLTPESPCIGAGENGETLGAPFGICGVTGAGEPEAIVVADEGIRVWPNPSGDLVHVSFRSDPDAYLELEDTWLARVLDASGRLVAVAHGRRVGFEVEFEWNTSLQNGELAPAGIYYLRPVANPGSSTKTARISVVR
jgi:hypothetical protein